MGVIMAWIDTFFVKIGTKNDFHISAPTDLDLWPQILSTGYFWCL